MTEDKMGLWVASVEVGILVLVAVLLFKYF